MTSLFKDNSAQLEGVTSTANNGGGYFFGRLYGDGGSFIDYDHINALTYYMGHGNDTMNVDGNPLATAGNSLAVDGGGGTDTLNANLGALTTAFSLKDSSLTSSNFSATNFEIYNLTLGSGADTLVLTHATGDAFVLGAGDDYVKITDAQGYTSIDNGADVDTLFVDNSSQSAGVTSTLSNGGGYFFGSLYNATSRTDFDRTEKITYSMGTGNDTLNLDGAPIPASSNTRLGINGGAGINTLNANFGGLTTAVTVTDTSLTTTRVNLTNFDILSLTLGSGNDSVTLNQSVAPSINLAAGNDTMSITNALTYEAVDMGAGTDTLTVDNSTQSTGVTSTLSNGGGYFFGSLYNDASRTDFDRTEKLTYTMGSGADTLNLDATPLTSSSVSLSVNSGSGSDVLNANLGALGTDIMVTAAALTSTRLSLTNFETYSLTLGSGNDSVTLSGSTAPALNMAGGNDTVSVTNVVGYQSIDSGAGVDSLTVDNGSQAIGVTSTINNGGGYFYGSLYNDTSRTDFDRTENVTYTMGSGADTLSLDGTPLATAGVSLSVDAGAGADTLNANLGALTTNITVSAASLTSTGLSLINFETYSLTFGSGNDSVTLAGAAAPALNMAAGNDSVTISNVAGYQSIDGGAGNDTLVIDNSGEGTDFSATLNNSGAAYFYGNLYNDTSRTDFDRMENITFDFGAGSNTANVDGNPINVGATLNLDGGAGNDTLNLGNLSGDTIQFISGGLIVNGTSHFTNFETINLSLGNGNTLVYGSGNNTITGSNSNDIIDGGLGNDIIDGSGGFDIAAYTSATSGVTVSLLLQGSGQNTHGSGTDTLTNFEGLLGSAYNDTLTGDGNGNSLDGAGGADTMSGGGGNDTYYVGNSYDVAQESAGGGTDTVISTVTYTLGANVENLVLSGSGATSGYGNSLENSLTGNGNANVLDGAGGADTMTGGGGNDTYYVGNRYDVVAENAGEGTDTVISTVTYTLTANVENLVLSGTAATNGYGNDLGNSLTGNASANLLDGGTGADTMIGGAGNDTYVVDNVGDVVTENASEGSDTVNASISYTLGANVERLILTGTANIDATGNDLSNYLRGNDGNNVLSGGAGSDTMVGGKGNDTYYVNSTGDVVTENSGEGTDTVYSTVSLTLASNVENLILQGTYNASATGNGLGNALTGNSHSNILTGGAGDDILTGGGGADRFVFGHFGSDNGLDHVTDFHSGTDFLVFAGSDYGFAAGHTLQASELSLTGAAVGGNAQFVYDPTTHELFWDANGSAAGGLTGIAFFDNGATPHRGDFLFT